MTTVVLGLGKVGSGLFAALESNSVPSQLVCSRSFTGDDIKQAERIIIACADQSIADVALKVSEQIQPPVTIVHCAASERSHFSHAVLPAPIQR